MDLDKYVYEAIANMGYFDPVTEKILSFIEKDAKALGHKYIKNHFDEIYTDGYRMKTGINSPNDAIKLFDDMFSESNVETITDKTKQIKAYVKYNKKNGNQNREYDRHKLFHGKTFTVNYLFDKNGKMLSYKIDV